LFLSVVTDPYINLHSVDKWIPNVSYLEYNNTQYAFTLTVSTTIRPIKRQTGHLQNYEQQFGYKESSETPGRVVYRVGGYYPGGSGYYPASAKGGNPGEGGKFFSMFLYMTGTCNHASWYNNFT
jgi:hypothetical protein